MKHNFNFDTTETAYYVDKKHNMMLHVNFGWDPTGDFGKGDSIGRTFEAYYTYKDERFLEGIKSCWVKVKKGNGYYYQGYRYPTHDDNDISRDHLFNTVLTLIASGYSEEQLKEFVTNVPFNISKKYNQTIDLWLWMRAVSGIWWAKLLSPIIEISLMAFTVLWQKLLYKIGGFKEESSQDEFMASKKYEKTKWEKTVSSLLYPSYTMTQYAWRLNFMKDSLYTKIMKKMLLKIANKHNYVVRLLLDDTSKPTQEHVYSYKSMMGGRWDGILNQQINDRDFYIITDEKLISSNVLDVDLVRTIYEAKNLK